MRHAPARGLLKFLGSRPKVQKVLIVLPPWSTAAIKLEVDLIVAADESHRERAAILAYLRSSSTPSGKPKSNAEVGPGLIQPSFNRKSRSTFLAASTRCGGSSSPCSL